MYLTRHQTAQGPRWALDGRLLPQQFSLSLLLELPQEAVAGLLLNLPPGDPAEGPLLSPIEVLQEVWASGVTYLRSREARETESTVSDVYAKVYAAERPELFFKASGWRVVGPGGLLRVRKDSGWNVPEPELVLVANRQGEIVGYCAGNDMSSRDIEGENPLYLPQAKIYNGSCALGPGILIGDSDQMTDLPVQLEINRIGALVFQGATRTSQMKRPLQELVDYLVKELDFPHGVFLMTGTGIVPPDSFSLQPGDFVRVTIGSLSLENEIEA